MFYDVYYLTPIGNPGIHSNIKADNPFDAAKQCACLLSLGTQWNPIEWVIINVTEAADKEFNPHVL